MSRGHHSLATLGEINSGDFPEFATIEITELRDCEFSKRTSHAERLPLEPGTELVLVPVRKTGPNPGIQVKPDVTAQPALDQNVLVA
jgi:hypothetical protein